MSANDTSISPAPSLFSLNPFKSHSGKWLPWKIECDAFTDEDWLTLATMVATKIKFYEARGIPSGGIKFAEKLNLFADATSTTRLLVDDVLTTGGSMTQAYNALPNRDGVMTRGIVVFSRMPAEKVPVWVTSIFQLGGLFI